MLLRGNYDRCCQVPQGSGSVPPSAVVRPHGIRDDLSRYNVKKPRGLPPGSRSGFSLYNGPLSGPTTLCALRPSRRIPTDFAHAEIGSHLRPTYPQWPPSSRPSQKTAKALVLGDRLSTALKALETLWGVNRSGASVPCAARYVRAETGLAEAPIEPLANHGMIPVGRGLNEITNEPGV